MIRLPLAAVLAAALAACGSNPPPAMPRTAARDAEEVTRLLPAIPLKLERCAYADPDNDKAYLKERQRYLAEHRRLEEIAHRVAARTTGQTLADLRGTAQAIAIARAEREFGGTYPPAAMCQSLLDGCQTRDVLRCPPVNVMAPDAVRTVLAASEL